jgi:hypothetical protein
MKACLYLLWWSAVNRLRVQVGRLRKPKYALVALLGAAYFYFFFFQFMWVSHKQSGPSFALLFGEGVAALPLLETAAALVVSAYVVFQWVLPRGNAALDFTQTEVAVLFPAPLSRRTLLHYRLLRAQGPLLFGTLIFWGLSGRMWRGEGAGWTLPAYWLLFGNIHLHSIGADFVRTRFEGSGRNPWLRRLGISALVLLSLGVSWLLARRSLPPFPVGDALSLGALTNYAQQLAASGPVFFLLEPCRWLVRPFLGSGAADTAIRMLPALGLLVLQYVWIASQIVSFEEASLQRSEQRAKVTEAIAAGRWQSAGATIKPVPPPFALRPHGLRLVAVLWKNLIAAHAVFRVQNLAGALAVLGLVMLAGRTLGGPKSPVFAISLALVMMATIVLFTVGAHGLSMDLRYDFAMMDVLKAWPVRGWQLLLGEVLTPTVLLTLALWAHLGLLGAVLEPQAPGKSLIKSAPAAFLLAAAMIAPAWNMASCLVLNGFLLLFPSWARPGVQHSQGIEAAGHGILLFLGHFLALAFLSLAPVAVATLFVLLTRKALAVAILAPGAALLYSATLAVELVFLLLMLGDLVERLDISDERPETV